MTPATLARRVGVLGGTFDPIHSGHIAIAEATLGPLKLERVDLVPSFSPPHRMAQPVAAPWHRWTMTVLGCADRPGLFASDCEIRRGGISYMIETLRSYRADGTGLTPVLLLGVDAFADLPSWRQPEELAAEFDIAVLTRPGFDPAAIMRGLPEWLRRRAGPLDRLAAGAAPDLDGGRIAPLPVPAHPVSATDIRNRLARGEPIESLVPEPVAEYIDRYRLYGG